MFAFDGLFRCEIDGILNDLMFRYFCILQNPSKLAKMLQNASKFAKILQNASKFAKLLQNLPKCFKMLQNLPNYFKMLQNLPKYLKMLQIFSKFCKTLIFQRLPQQLNSQKASQTLEKKLTPSLKY